MLKCMLMDIYPSFLLIPHSKYSAKLSKIHYYRLLFPTGIVIMILWNIVKIIYFKGQIDVAFKIGNENRIFGGPVPHLVYQDRP